MSKLLYFRTSHDANAVMAGAADVAASHGYINRAGANPGGGNVAELLAAIASGEVATVKLDDAQRNAVIMWLATRAAPPPVNEALFEIAAAMDEARQRKGA